MERSPSGDDLLKGLLLVTGKGGTGKTTLSVALARLAASRGRRVLLLEVDNQHPSLTDYFGVTPAYRPLQVDEGLSIANVHWLDALEDWLDEVLPLRRIVRLVLSNRLVRMFLDVAPGSRELTIFDRVLRHAEEHELVVVDLPASGHALSMLRVPYQAIGLFATGPVRALCERIMESLESPTTHLLQAALPEEMVVNETIETWHALASLRPELAPVRVLLNKALEPSLTPDQLRLLEALHGESRDAPPGLRELLRAGRWEAEHEVETARALERLSSELDAPVDLVPLLPGAGEADGVARRVQEHLASLLFPAEEAA